MGVENKGTRLKPTFILFLVILHLFLSTLTKCSFTPHVNYLLDCGSSHPTQLTDGRTFKSDRETISLLATDEDVQISLHSNISPFVPSSFLPLYQTARVFQEEPTYSFYISKTGRLWVRLYFFPLSNPSYNLTSAVFSVQTTHHVLLHEFSARNNDSPVFKEYLVNISDNSFSLKFKPKKNSFAFINAIEVVSAPDTLISDSATALSPLDKFKGLFNSALEVSYRINVGGPTITPDDDTLARTWETDGSYNIFPQGSETISVSKQGIKYPHTRVTPLIAPNLVYASAVHVKNATATRPNFNLSWMVSVDRSNSYLIRMHLCDIILSKSLNHLYLNVYINGIEGVSVLNLSSQTKALATAFYQDFVLNKRDITNGSILVQVGPTHLPQGTTDAILNGFEVMKISNIADSLDGLYSVDGKYKGPCSTSMEIKILAYVGLALAVTTIMLLVITCIRWKKRPQGVLLPIHSPISCSRKSSCGGSTTSSSRKSNKHGHRVTPQGPKRFFPFGEMQQATNNFDENKVIGVGGFGKVYLGTLKDGTKVAIRRGSGNSEQGINEFRTELEMLSKLRHRHLVSLIARGLYYLHTGAAQSITHRDVKTTNILLDENYIAKVSDFGLSKVVPDEAQVSTAVKGSFGYLDPEYYRSQQLTQKSDIYSFGVVVFEVLCARPVICLTHPAEEINLAEWAKKQHRRGVVNEIIDPRIVVTINPQSLSVFVEIAERCLADRGVDRPSMGDVLWHLEYALRLQEAASRIDQVEDKDASIDTNEDNSVSFSEIDNLEER
ncbi:interleukin-1 receptor-associated kinase 4 [Vigna unguiculata]|uniref:Interleukin-1 receptor-associated kinase 4 n=1 Tax=Vigna unguiculata TaxID=3917 RepID=A0A4D6KWU3_VIGUN|nr:interleukin-1 receptor-associated kinase 4 [Vigna unguiculata]